MFEQHKDAHLAISRLAPEFLLYAKVELAFSPETITKYRDCLRQVEKICGDLPVTEFSKENLLVLKGDLIGRNLSVNRQVGIVLALKRFLRYLAEEKSLVVYDWQSIQPPRRQRKPPEMRRLRISTFKS